MDAGLPQDVKVVVKAYDNPASGHDDHHHLALNMHKVCGRWVEVACGHCERPPVAQQNRRDVDVLMPLLLRV